jgi:uncharacterized membrane protein YphA (DoxX/SURF4 family)
MRGNIPGLNSSVSTLCCTLLIVLFAYAGLSKLLGWQLFAWQIHRSPAFAPIAMTVAFAVPILEFFTCALLLSKTRKLAGFFWSSGLLILFTLYILLLLHFNHNVPCSCGGVLQFLTWKQHVWFNLFFIAVGFTGIVFTKRAMKMNPKKAENR